MDSEYYPKRKTKHKIKNKNKNGLRRLTQSTHIS